MKPTGSPVSSISGMTSGLGQFVLSPSVIVVDTVPDPQPLWDQLNPQRRKIDTTHETTVNVPMILYGDSGPEWSRNWLSNWTIKQTTPGVGYRLGKWCVDKSVLYMMQDTPEILNYNNQMHHI